MAPPLPPARPPLPEPRPLAPVGTTVVVAASGADAAFDRLLDERVVVVGGEIDDAVAHRVTAQLLLLAARDARRDITLYVGSAGGSVAAGLAIHDAMQLVAPDVATCAVGITASVGQLLVTAGAPGKRSALPHARLRLRRPAGASPAASMGQEMAVITAQRSGQAVERVLADTEAERWFSAVEAVAYGLVDAVSAPASARVG